MYKSPLEIYEKILQIKKIKYKEFFLAKNSSFGSNNHACVMFKVADLVVTVIC